ncbi:hypothetical protein [Massilia sp. S19_KUP03_FR1]|uniref:hypothetical protein n=1 Tax=Massilia sp. S19_KUP03_FR1 TaxID=3025503 RepID=UPI002FCD6BA0
MQHTLVAVFDNRNDAQQAMDELLASSFTSTNVRLSQGDTTGAIGDTTAAPVATPDDDSFATSIRNFFSDIFGSDDSVNAKRYASAVTSGQYVLTVGPVSEPEVERAADIVERFGPVDIDEESSGAEYGSVAGGLGADQIMRRDSASMQGGQSQSLSFQSDDRAPFQQGNLNDPVPMGGTYQEPMESGQRLSSTGGMSMQDGTQQGSMQRADLNSGSGLAPTEIKRPGVRVFARDPGDLGNTGIRTSGGIGSLGADALQQSDNDSAFRSHWSSNYDTAGGSYDEYAPAYGYGSQLASDDKYRGRSWDDAESDIRSDWESRNAGTTSTWDKMKAAVRHGWERMTA